MTPEEKVKGVMECGAIGLIVIGVVLLIPVWLPCVLIGWLFKKLPGKEVD